MQLPGQSGVYERGPVCVDTEWPAFGCDPALVPCRPAWPCCPTQVTGPALTLAGFPAWCVRASEIYGVGPLAAVTPARLAGALRRFGATKQRFGK